ncbi:MAG: conjugal transfer protein TraF [Sulfurimonadaceae bacterium]
MKNKFSLAALAALCVTSAHAMQFQTIGYKSVAMGGAAVANSTASTATYDNPALLAKARYDVEISLGGGVSFHDHGAGAAAQELDDSGFLDTLDKLENNIASLTPADVADLFKGKDIIMGMDGATVAIAPQASFGVQIGNFGFGVFGSSDAVATAVVSQAHDQVILQDSGNYVQINSDGSTTSSNLVTYQANSIEYAVNNGLTYLDVKAIGIAEVPLAYGHLFELSGGNLMVGGAVKYMHAFTYRENLRIDSSDSDDNGKKDNNDGNFGIDLGLAYEPFFAKELTLGVVAKNLNKPEFSFVTGETIEVEPMVRAGAAYNVGDMLEIAVDMDITKNETFVPGIKNQMLGGGVSFHPVSWFALRGGAMKNLDSNDEAGVIYTAGLGFGLKWFQLDISGQMSGKTNTVEDTEYPRYAKVNVALISRW